MHCSVTFSRKNTNWYSFQFIDSSLSLLVGYTGFYLQYFDIVEWWAERPISLLFQESLCFMSHRLCLLSCRTDDPSHSPSLVFSSRNFRAGNGLRGHPFLGFSKWVLSHLSPSRSSQPQKCVCLCVFKLRFICLSFWVDFICTNDCPCQNRIKTQHQKQQKETWKPLLEYLMTSSPSPPHRHAVKSCFYSYAPSIC